MSTPLPPVTSTRVGQREISLLLIAAGFALLMFDLGNLAVVTGWTVVAIWAYGMIRGPRPSPRLTALYGAGLFLTTFWWPEQGWWIEAIALMWAGLAMIVFGLVWGFLSTRRKPQSAHP